MNLVLLCTGVFLEGVPKDVSCECFLAVPAAKIFGFAGGLFQECPLGFLVQCLSRSVLLERSKSVYCEWFSRVSMHECFLGPCSHE